MRAVATRAGEFTFDGFIKRSIVSHYQPYTYRYLIQCYSFIIIRLLFITSHIFSSRALVRAWIGHVNHMPHHSPHLPLALLTPTFWMFILPVFFTSLSIVPIAIVTFQIFPMFSHFVLFLRLWSRYILVFTFLQLVHLIISSSSHPRTVSFILLADTTTILSLLSFYIVLSIGRHGALTCFFTFTA